LIFDTNRMSLTIFPAICNGAKHRAFSTNHLTDIDKTKHTSTTKNNTKEKQTTTTTRKLCYRKDDRAMQVIQYECPENPTIES